MIKITIKMMLLITIMFSLGACGSEKEQENDDSVAAAEIDKTDKEQEKPKGKIVMPHSSDYYENSDWTTEKLTEHFKELGFTEVEYFAHKPDEDNYKKNIFYVDIRDSMFSDGPWEAGEEFDSDDRIMIQYNEYPLLTIENCSDLNKVLTSKEMDYMSFCNTYDGQFVEFDAHVIAHSTYHGDTGHVLCVLGGDYKGGMLGSYDPDDYEALIIHVGDKIWGNTIDYSVIEGDNVRVSGQIDADDAKYFKDLYVDAVFLEKR